MTFRSRVNVVQMLLALTLLFSFSSEDGQALWNGVKGLLLLERNAEYHGNCCKLHQLLSSQTQPRAKSNKYLPYS